MSIDTSHTHSFSCLICAISSASLSLHSALEAVVLVLAHLHLHLQQPQRRRSRTPPPVRSFMHRPRRSHQSRVSLISGHPQKYVGSYALLAISREPFELCPHFKSLPSIARRELSIDLRWPASKLETQNPPLRSDSKISLVLGEGGGNRLIDPQGFCTFGVRIIHTSRGMRSSTAPLQPISEFYQNHNDHMNIH